MRALSLSGFGLYLLCCTAFYGLPPNIKHENSINRTAAAPDVINLEQWGGGLARLSQRLRDYRCPLTGERLKTHKVVINALNEAWRISNHGTPHALEAGGWIYQDRRGRLTHLLQEPKYWEPRAVKEHGDPPDFQDRVVVALYHVHPNYTRPDDDPEPSGPDVKLAKKYRVPGLVKSRNGIYVYGPPKGFWYVGPLNCR
jgi:proteasome lid subunit RPN8/RPN11